MLSWAEALLVVSIGACAHLAALRLWLSASDRGPSRYAAGWALAAVVFSSARLVQVTTTEPATAVLAARIQLGATPFLVWGLHRLVGAVTGYQPGRVARAATFALASALALGAHLTPYFVDPAPVPRLVAGEPYLGLRPGPLLGFVGLVNALGILWCIQRVARSPELAWREKRDFGLALGLYTAMGISSLVSALELAPIEGALEYGPLVLAIGISRLLALRQRRLADELEQQIAASADARRESETRLRRVIENAPIGILTVNADGGLDQANRALLALLGSTREQFESAFNVADEENARSSGFSAMFARALASGEVLTSEFEFDTWWGKRLHTRTTVSPYRDGQGVAGAIAIVEDITEQRTIEKRLQRAQRLEAVGQLAAGIAHEINNPMAYVRSNLSVLGEELAALEKDCASSQAPSLETRSRIRFLERRRAEALANVERTVAIVRDLREFSRTSGGVGGVVDANAQLEHAARLAGARTDGLAEVALELGAVPPVAIDASQLRQVLLNLLTHAQQAAGARGHVRAATRAGEGCVLISVHDDGPPIRPEERERLFEPFALTRGESEPTLGLYVSQQIVREHEGRIDVLSGDAHGTTFVVRLPTAAEEGSEAAEDSAAAR
jgi:PAS domain S-box-containing protein